MLIWEKRLRTPKTDTPIILFQFCFNTCRSVRVLHISELSLVSASEIICSMLALYQKDARTAGNDSVICS